MIYSGSGFTGPETNCMTSAKLSIDWFTAAIASSPPSPSLRPSTACRIVLPRRVSRHLRRWLSSVLPPVGRCLAPLSSCSLIEALFCAQETSQGERRSRWRGGSFNWMASGQDSGARRNSLPPLGISQTTTVCSVGGVRWVCTQDVCSSSE